MWHLSVTRVSRAKMACKALMPSILKAILKDRESSIAHYIEFNIALLLYI